MNFVEDNDINLKYINTYFKNKNAYITLRGGDDKNINAISVMHDTKTSHSGNINTILVTHNARMRCFLAKYFKNDINNYLNALNPQKTVKTKSKTKEIKEIRFKN